MSKDINGKVPFNTFLSLNAIPSNRSRQTYLNINQWVLRP